MKKIVFGECSSWFAFKVFQNRSHPELASPKSAINFAQQNFVADQLNANAFFIAFYNISSEYKKLGKANSQRLTFGDETFQVIAEFPGCPLDNARLTASQEIPGAIELAGPNSILLPNFIRNIGVGLWSMGACSPRDEPFKFVQPSGADVAMQHTVESQTRWSFSEAASQMR